MKIFHNNHIIWVDVRHHNNRVIHHNNQVLMVVVIHRNMVNRNPEVLPHILIKEVSSSNNNIHPNTPSGSSSNNRREVMAVDHRSNVKANQDSKGRDHRSKEDLLLVESIHPADSLEDTHHVIKEEEAHHLSNNNNQAKDHLRSKEADNPVRKKKTGSIQGSVEITEEVDNNIISIDT